MKSAHFIAQQLKSITRQRKIVIQDVLKVRYGKIIIVHPGVKNKNNGMRS